MAAFILSVGVRPWATYDQMLAEKLDLLPNTANLLKYSKDDIVDGIQNKLRANEKITSSEKKVLDTLWDTSMQKGFSHVGIVNVKSDPETNIKMVWIYDNYPNSDLGGIRVVQPEGFAFPELYNKIGFARNDPFKVFSEYKNQIYNRGFQSHVWTSQKSYLQNGYFWEVPNSPYFWNSNVSKEQVKSWMSTSNFMAPYWYQGSFLPKVFSQIKNYFTGTEAMGFSTGFENLEGAAYCSQMIILAFLQGTNFDPEIFHDIWNEATPLTSKLGLLPFKVDSSKRIISPNGLMWQSRLIDQTFQSDLSRSRVLSEQQNALETNGKPTVADSRIDFLAISLKNANVNFSSSLDLSSFQSDTVDIDLEDNNISD
jgi:hypothetical protein